MAQEGDHDQLMTVIFPAFCKLIPKSHVAPVTVVLGAVSKSLILARASKSLPRRRKKDRVDKGIKKEEKGRGVFWLVRDFRIQWGDIKISQLSLTPFMIGAVYAL